MPPSLSTSNRMYFLTLHEYGEDDLLIAEMAGHEAMSQLFEFRLRLLSSRDDIDPRRIIGKPAILRIEAWDTRHMGGERHWNGVVSRFQRTGRASSAEGEDLYAYECDIVPWFWFMTQHEDCRIFQGKTVREIIEAIFEEFDYSDFRFDLHEDHPALDYCTQYHETTFDFISRLVEREGIHYYFRHDDAEESRHLLVFTDHNRGNPALEPSTLPFHHEGTAEDYDAIRTLALDQQMRTRKVTLGDWDFERKRLLRENTPTVLSIGADRDLERYRYPGAFVDPEVGKYRSRVLMEAEEAGHMRFRGDSQVRTLAPGHTFTLEDHPFDEFNIEYMVLSVWHHGRNNLGNDGAAEYGNEFTLHPHAVTWRAPLSTPKGLVRGPQTALVTGPAGEELHVDQHGRIKVQFHWDRQGQYDDHSSCWVRVAQAWAGNGYGTMFIPRVGMEVVVDFLEGDPDQPLVTGCVYNGINKPPYDLPAHATRSTIKTLSSKGGGGTNELRFEDKKGSEEVFLQAQKALNVQVKANEHHQIGGSLDLKVGDYRKTTIEANDHLHVKGDQGIAVQGQMTVAVVDGPLEFQSGSEAKLLSKAKMEIASKQEIAIHGGTQLVMEANGLISLKVGASGIVIDPSGVSVVGPMIKQNSGGAPSAAITSIGTMIVNAAGTHSTQDGSVIDPIQQLQAQALRNAALAGQPFCAECEAARAALEALMA
ncbi:type VI secretion system Vgr family protein [Thermomonas mangrovi]|uniref:type VI secretion system Vgr family protein n=1 Tax=Thermomonas mangrovi TaxID=2993316 RepID=UPI002307B705|nr:type VI secretion system tip protein VgrG [Thermomonas mangrovi]